MKKMLSVLLLIVFSMSACVASAEIPNVKDLSSEELYELQEVIMQELGEKGDLPSFTAPIGVYEAGKDFPVGKYKITAISYATYITIYENMQAYDNEKALERKRTLYQSNGDEKVVNFKNEMVVYVDFSNARFEPFTGLVFQ